MKWVAKRVACKLRVHPNLNHVEAHEHLREQYGVHIDERNMFMAIKEAQSLVKGSIQLQYAKLWDYSHELTISNEGSTMKINCIPIPRSPPQFHQIYICLDACKQGFKAGCGHFIGLDGCFLKGYYGSHLLVAMGQDANNAFFVIVYVVVNVEDKDN